jgi:hypothetical protein
MSYSNMNLAWPNSLLQQLGVNSTSSVQYHDGTVPPKFGCTVPPCSYSAPTATATVLGPYLNWAHLAHGLLQFWTHPMKLLGDVGHVESYFSPFGESVSVGAR